MEFSNVYEDEERARSYDRLEFPGTYALAYRDLPALLAAHAKGTRALDFGCGAGRSTRFLQRHGFETIGIDVSEPMLARARERDPHGSYLRSRGDDFAKVVPQSFDLVLSAFTFDNVPTVERKVALFRGLRHLLRAGGVIVNLVSSPDIYVHEWASFSTRDFPANRDARSGDPVRIVMLDVEDARPVEDVLCTDETWARVYREAGLEPFVVHRPLGRPDEPHAWVSETHVAPWVIYVLRPA